MELLGLHTGCILHTNMLADIRIVKSTGFEAIEILVPKLERYLAAGYRVDNLAAGLGATKVNMLNRLPSIDGQESESMRELYRDCERLCEIAQALSCPNLQVVALTAYQDLPWAEARAKPVRTLKDLADIAAPFGVRLGFEPVVFTPFRSLASVLEIIDATERDNVGLVVDTFHHWAAGDSWDEIARLDSALIASVHISDAMEKAGEEWRDNDRDVLPGDGVIPLPEGIAAVRNTGYDGVWAVEILGPSHWEWDPAKLAGELRQRVAALLAG
jgi:sugar phosphate isomerase/epimerase